jgi:hypothetical protein
VTHSSKLRHSSYSKARKTLQQVLWQPRVRIFGSDRSAPAACSSDSAGGGAGLASAAGGAALASSAAGASDAGGLNEDADGLKLNDAAPGLKENDGFAFVSAAGGTASA